MWTPKAYCLGGLFLICLATLLLSEDLWQLWVEDKVHALQMESICKKFQCIHMLRFLWRLVRFSYIDISICIRSTAETSRGTRCFYMCGLMKCVFHTQLEEASASEKRACHEKSAMIAHSN